MIIVDVIYDASIVPRTFLPCLFSTILDVFVIRAKMQILEAPRNDNYMCDILETASSLDEESNQNLIPRFFVYRLDKVRIWD